MNAKDRIRELCKQQNIKPYNLECELGFSHSTLTKGEDITAKRLLAVAKYFNVTMEYLMGEDIKTHSISDFEFKIIESYRNAQPGMQDAVLKLLDVHYRALNIPGQCALPEILDRTKDE